MNVAGLDIQSFHFVSSCRIRSATPAVVKLLIDYGADVNQTFHTNGVSGVTPVHIILHTAAHFMTNRGHLLDETTDLSSTKLENSNHSKLRSTGVKSWIRTLNILLTSGCLPRDVTNLTIGAQWNPLIQMSKGETELYLLLLSFPPPREDISMYRAIVSSCLSCPEMNPLIEDENGRSALFIFCERLSKVNSDAFPESVNILKMVLDHTGGGIGGADRTGRTIFDIEDDTTYSGYSCLKASRHLLVQAGALNIKRGSKVFPKFST